MRAVSGDAVAMDDGCPRTDKSGVVFGSSGGAIDSPECTHAAGAGCVCAVSVTRISSAGDDDDTGAAGGEVSRSLATA